ncbi:LysR family transcriptional regulator [Azospirillum canadense]|uniref:LysR family transcriptional regulator n=1 Tax=Azospirillum canadense TaxID=403962 RepID=UPI002226F85F|nr:LysR substrate-binding domain-containing protein [Azospirillum canadense]MCW2239907.1 LysR family nitrogen assimilation transcriptional regulator [Azospirillum canadense]
MDFRQLGNFLHVAELQSLSRAASVLRVAQPALSRQIKSLEEELGVQLLQRHGWGVTPTPAGRVLMEHARRVLKEVGAARDAVQAYQMEPSGTVTFGTPTSLGSVMLPGLAARFRRQAPKVRLHLVEGFSASIHEWVLSGRLDLAVLYETKTMGSLATTPLLEESMVLLGPAGRFGPGSEVGLAELDLAEVAGLGLILPARPHRLRLLVDQAFAERDLASEPILEVDALPALIELVRMGEGCTLLPFSCVSALMEEGRLSAAAVVPAIRRSLVLARPPDRIPTPASEALERAVLAFIQAQAATLRWTVPRTAVTSPDVEESGSTAA